MTTNMQDYALLLLARTRLTYHQISDLTGLSINRIGGLAQTTRPKEVRDENVTSGVKPDIQEELIRLKQEMERESPELLTPFIPNFEDMESLPSGSEPDIERIISFTYSASTNRPVSKETLLLELERMNEELDTLNADSVELHISIEGV